jgi:hypothetical protein
MWSMGNANNRAGGVRGEESEAKAMDEKPSTGYLSPMASQEPQTDQPLDKKKSTEKSKRRVRWTWAVAVFVAILYCSSVFFYNRSLPVDLGFATVEPSSDGVGAYFAMRDIQLETDRVSADLLVTFGEELAECTPLCGLREDVTLLVSPSTQSVIKLPRGTPAGYSIPIVLFLEGAPYSYPFDTYLSRVYVQAVTIDSGGTAYPVPLVAEFLVPEGFVGWQIQLGYPNADDNENAESFLKKDREQVNAEYVARAPTVIDSGQAFGYLSMERALSTKIIAVLVLLLMIILAGLAVIASHDVQVGKKTNDGLGMAGWLTGSLFAMPALRALLPGAPPLGSWIDILVFFWVEIATMISLATFVLFWIRQSTIKGLEPKEEQAPAKES